MNSIVARHVEKADVEQISCTSSDDISMHSEIFKDNEGYANDHEVTTHHNNLHHNKKYQSKKNVNVKEAQKANRSANKPKVEPEMEEDIGEEIFANDHEGAIFHK